jgi:hypothetical protein
MDEPLNQRTQLEADREAFLRSRRPPKEQFDRLVQMGWIDSRGRVTTLLGGTAQPEAHATPGQAPSAEVSIDASVLEEAKRLIDCCGGIEKARAVLAAVEQQNGHNH